jgi:hypothetical protein
VSLDIDNLLSSMAREGKLDSTGSFTIDLATAQAKLAKFTLPDSRAYILKMVQAAVAGRASELHLDSRTQAVEVRILGLQIEQEGLELLLFKLAESGKALPRATYHLAVGIRAALGLESREIRIVSRNGTTEKRVLWSVGGIEHEVVDCDLPAETVLIFTRTNGRYWKELLHNLGYRGLSRLVMSSRDGLDEEQRLVNDICCQAPLLITINGSKVPRLAYLPSPTSFTARGRQYPHTQEVLYPITSNVERGFLPPLNFRSPLVVGRKLEHAALELKDFECHLMLGLHPHIQETQIMVILDGVLIKRTSVKGFGYTAILAAGGLTTDLTGFQIVENEQYQKCCELIDQTARRIVKKR